MTSLFLGALIGFASAFLLRSWQYRRDVWLKRVENLCSTVDLAAQSSTEYWTARDDDAALSDTTKTDIAEARILGLQTRIDGMVSALELDEPDKARILFLLGDLRDCLTGGSFAGAQRRRDLERARLVQMFASDLIVAVWAAAYSHLSFFAWLKRRTDQLERVNTKMARQVRRSLDKIEGDR